MVVEQETLDARPVRKRWWRSGLYMLFGLLWLFEGSIHLRRRPETWGWAAMFALGIFAVVVAVHPVSRAVLGWPATHLDAGEHVLASVRGNWVHRVARGGTIVITDRRVVFEPNTVETTLHLTTHDWELTDISDLDLAPRGLNVFGGASRRRLRMHLNDGHQVLFVVGEPAELLMQVKAALHPGRDLSPS